MLLNKINVPSAKACGIFLLCQDFQLCTVLLLSLLFQTESHAITQAGVQWCNLSSLQPLPPGSSDSRASASRVTGIRGTRYYAQLIFVLWVEMRVHHVGQAGLKLLTSDNLPTLASQSAGNYRRGPLYPACTVFLKHALTCTI